MTKTDVFFFGLVFMLLAGCTSAPVKDIKINAQADVEADFSGYKTYAWLGGATIVNDPDGQWEPPGFDADQEIKYLINRELRNRGMSENRIEPDLYVIFAAGIDMAILELKTDPESQIEIQNHLPQGGLMVALVDSETGTLIWLGIATGKVQQNIGQKAAKTRLDYAVTKLLKKMPE